MSFVFGEYRYIEPLQSLRAFSTQEIKDAFEILQKPTCGYWIGYITYEAYLAFQNQDIQAPLPFLEFTLFAKRIPYQPPKCQKTFVPHHLLMMDFPTYAKKIQAIKEQITLGNTYQSNFTTFLHFQSSMEIEEIFTSLHSKQNTAYKALLKTPYRQIASFSPELFFEIKGNTIAAEPMKGTIHRGKTEQEDEKNMNFLQNDVKNRSENVMIVDLLRNDLNQIATNVRVPELFSIHQYPTLFQMTSKICGDLKPQKTLWEIFQALFPCGSITGAPKKSTIQILQTLENEERGVYCGAIGLISAEQTIFSIPIRTIVFQEQKYRYGVGSGIVWDSQEQSEYEELQTKMRFLSPSFDLVETLLWDKEYLFLQDHLKRLQASAESLGFVYPPRLEQDLRERNFASPCIVRVCLSKNGDFRIVDSVFEPHLSDKIALQVREEKSDLMFYKTTFRPWYAMQKIKEYKLFDVVYLSPEGYLLEGARSNLVLLLEGKLWTPPLELGILNGIYRQRMLKEAQMQERLLTLQDLQNAQKIFCINSVRQRVEVRLFNGLKLL